MEKKIIRLAVIILATLFQVSFLSVFFSEYRTPSVIVALVVAWTVCVGFDDIFFWIILLGIVLDVVGFQPLGANIIPLILIVYFVSFVSRRFLIEHKVWNSTIMMFFVAAATLFYYFFLVLFSGFDDFLFVKSFLFWKTAAIQTIYNAILFLFVYFLLRKTEEIISSYDRRIRIK